MREIQLTLKEIRAFRKTIYKHYAAHGRHDLLWRQTGDPYKILVSEIMLQQTYVARVLPKYILFIKKFPDIHALARASFHDVLSLWIGLGYNRRAKYLHTLARVVAREHGGILPNDSESLQKLPGIGRATACALRAFAFNASVVFIETNIRSVFIHYLKNNCTQNSEKHNTVPRICAKTDENMKVSDKEIFSLIEQTLDRENPREWYWALMDFGAWLKAEHGNPNKKSVHYKKQTPFHGSQREIRGKIIKTLAQNKNMSESALVKNIASDVLKI